MLSRFSVLFPLVLILVAFVLANLCLFAGRDKGFMEDYAIARLNTSMLGHNMIDSDSSSSSDDDDDDDSFLDTLEDKWDDIKNDIKDEINNITGTIADELAETLGISEWYSLHIMDTCEGYFKPNATSPGAGLNVTNCTESAPDERFNLTAMLDHELSIGPFELSVADLDWPDSIDDAIDTLNDALLALFVLYVLAVGFSGLAMLGCVAGFFLMGRRWLTLANLALTSLAATCLLVGSIIITVAVHKGVHKINDVGEDVGLSASKGNKFITLTWISTAFMLAAGFYWTAENIMIKRQRRREWTHRKSSI